MQTKSETSSGTTQVSVAAMTAAVALLAASLSVRASTSDLQLRHQFQIPSESLNAALTDLSAQSHIQVVTSGVPPDVVSPGISGNISTVKALTALLRGTGMSFRQADADTIVVSPGQKAQGRPTQYQLAGDAFADTAAAAPAAAAPSELTEVQVTGTRIIRQGYEAPTPVTAIGIQTLQDAQQPNIGLTLNQLPQFQGSTTPETSSTGEEGEQTELNLRNLGGSRNLVLFDGRRLPTANTEDEVDIDIIPETLIQRVDVVTGGASAVYGSDAVAGVVNFVLDTNFTGFKGSVQGGVSGYGDGPSDKIEMAFGTTLLDGKLHVLVSGDQSYQAYIPSNDRAWNIDGAGTINNPAYATNKHAPEFLAEGCCIGTTYPAGGLILSGPLQGTAFGTGGTPYQWDYGYGLTTPGDFSYGGDNQQNGSIQGSDPIVPADSATHFFARLGFDLTPNTQIYAEWMEGNDHENNECCPDYYQTSIGTLYTSNPYIPAQTVAAAATAGVTSFPVGDVLRFVPGTSGDWGTIGQNHYRTTDVYVLGFKGQLTIGKDSYNWSLYGQQGIDTEYHYDGPESIKINLNNAIQAVRVGTYGANSAYTDLNGKTLVGYNAANFPNPLNIPVGTITCASNLLPLNNPNETTNCVPMNIFGSQPCNSSAAALTCIGNASQASINYTQESAYWRQVGTQTVVGADISGEPFSDWAGPVSVDVDAEYRREAAQGFTDPLSETIQYFSTNYFAFYGAQDVKEGAVEVVAPMLKGLPFVQELDANAAARATDYSTSGYVTTWKMGLEYTPINDLRFRVVYSEDIRQPSLFNLFGETVNHGTTIDPFNGNVGAPSYSISGPNPNLRPEKAHQYELGLVFQPSEVPGFNFSIDYYNINISSGLGGLPNPLTACYGTEIPGTFTGTSPLCPLVVRTPCTPCPGTSGEAPGTLYSTETYSINDTSIVVEGTDYSADYRKQLTELVASWKGALDVHVAATDTIQDISNTGIPGTLSKSAVGVGSVPRWAMFGTLSYELDPWRITWTEKYDSSVLSSSSFIVCGPNNCPVPIPANYTTIGYNNRIGTYFLANLAINYKFMQHDQQEAEAFINVNNVLNKQPWWGGGISSGLFSHDDGNIAYFDTIGVYLRAGVRFRL